MDNALENAHQFWRQQAYLDSVKNRERKYQQGRGPCDIFILDTSSNVGKEGFIQLKETFCTIMDEYAKYPETDENVAVVICGRTTAFKHNYSNQYTRLKRCIDDIEYGGPCPLSAAFLLSEGAICNGAGYSKRMGNFYIHPRVIVLSAGRPTDFTMINNTNDLRIHTPAEVKDHWYQIARHIGRFHPIFCIPVGNSPDMANLGFISALSRGGKIVNPQEARQFAKISENLKVAATLTFSTTFDRLDRRAIIHLISEAMPERKITEMDKDDIFDICSRKSIFKSMDEIKAENEKESSRLLDPSMPPLGSRVKRGPNWMWKNQDHHGPGTVVAHSENAGWLIVHWDAGTSADYRYGFIDKYDVVVCIEPRIIQDELIAVGCLVRRGSDWDFSDQDGGAGSIGVVYNVNPNGVVNVSWSNGNKCNYKYGSEGEFELTLCDPFSPCAQSYLQEQRRCAAFKLPNTLRRIYCDATSEDGPDMEKRKMTQDHKVTNNRGVLLKTPKGRYFKNDSINNDKASDIEADCPDVEALSVNGDHWLWKDEDGIWNHYPRKINDKIMKCYKRNPNSTAVILFKEHLYRVVLPKRLQINLTTKETTDVKLVKMG